MTNGGTPRSDKGFRLGKGLLGLFVVGSLLGCFGGGCDLDFSSLTPEGKPDLGLTRNAEGALVVLVPPCVGSVQRIILFDDAKQPVWEVYSPSPTTLPTSFVLGVAPSGFLTTVVPMKELVPTSGYRLMVGPAYRSQAPVTAPSTTASTSTSTTVSVPAAGAPSTVATTSTTSTPSTVSTEEEAVFVLLAEGLADFQPDQVTSDHILMDTSQVDLEAFSNEACATDNTTTTR